MCIYVDDDGSIVLDHGTRRARKTHRCQECGRVIDKGETYRYWVQVGGECRGVETSKMCAHCWATVEAGAAMTGCPKQWYWDKVFDLDPEDGGFVGDILTHDLTAAQRALMRRCARRGRARWRDESGRLFPVPRPVGPLASEVSA